MPWHGHVKFVPSMRNWFSLTPDPNGGDGVDAAAGRRRGRHAGRRPNHVEYAERRVGMLRSCSWPNRVAKPLSPAPISDSPSTTSDWGRGHPETWRPVEGHPGANRDVLHANGSNRGGSSTTSVDVPGARTGNRTWPRSFVVATCGPPMSAGDERVTRAPGSTPPCSSLTVAPIAPVTPCAPAAAGITEGGADEKQHRDMLQAR